MDSMPKMIAVCGIDCEACPLYRASFDPEAAQSLVGWFRGEGWLPAKGGAREIMEGAPYCLGCRSDRTKHWSANCGLLTCCVDEKGLDSCHECDAFACEQLTAWAQKAPKYARALERLQAMRDEAKA